MAYVPTTTRRSLLAIATAATLLPRAVQAAPRDPWADLIAAYGQCHPNAPAAFARARKAGLDPTALSAVTLTGSPSSDRLPALWFGDIDAGDYSVVTPVGGAHYRRFH